MKYKKILVALDRSPQSDLVFEQALEIAKTEEAALMLFYCVPLETQRVGLYADVYGGELLNFSKEMQTLFKQEKEEARKWLVDYCQKATKQGVSTQWNLKVGDAGSRIRELATLWDADLIVLGRRGRRGLAEIVLGSVSNHVVHHAPCSVLVVQGIEPSEDEKLLTTTYSSRQGDS